MTAEKHIRHYNRLNGNRISTHKLAAFALDIQRDIDARRIDSHVPFGVELLDIKKRIENVLRSTKKNEDLLIELKPISLDKYKTPTKSAKHTTSVEKTTCGKVVAELADIKKIYTDTKRFQNRQDAFSEASADSVAKNYDPNKFDPIVVWADTKAKKTFVLSGHSRYEGMKRRKSPTIAVRYFSGSEAEAIQFAKVEANRGANQETLIEDLAAYKLMRDGDTSRKITKLSKGELQRIFKGKVQKLEAYSHLSKDGLFVNALSQSTTSNYPYLERNAQWIGQLRKEHTAITNTGEDNIFHFFYSDKTGKHLKLSKDEFFKLASRKINTLGKGEGILFPECGSEGCTKINERENDPLKGETYKRLREVNETLASINDKLKSNDPKVRVTTQAERDYLVKELAPKLQAEKEKLQADLNIADTQKGLFGYESPYQASEKEIKSFINITTRYPKSNTFLWQDFEKKDRVVLGIETDKVSKLFDRTEGGEYKISALGLSLKRTIIEWGLKPGDDVKKFLYTKKNSRGKLKGPQFNVFKNESSANRKAKKGKLNKLQKSQLQESIKAGATVKINSGKGSNNKGWTDTPLFETALKEKQTSLFGTKNKLINAKSLGGMKFKTLPFTGRWKDHIGVPSENFSAMIWGKPKQGKTHYAFQLAKYLTEFGEVLYILSDEGVGYTIADKIKANGLTNNEKVHFYETRQVTEVDQVIKNLKPKFVFIDLISNIKNGDEKLTPDQFHALRKKYPSISFLPVFASTKNGSFKGDQDWGHDVDVLVDVEAGVANAQGRFGGGEYKIFKSSEPATDKPSEPKLHYV